MGYRALAAAACAASMSGCVAWDIRDELRQTNQHLETSNQRLASIKGALDEANSELGDVKASLSTTNESMADIQKRLAVLDSIERSLTSLDDSLKTVKSLIEKIPFVGPSDQEKKDAEEQRPAQEKPGGGDQPKGS